MATIDNRNWKMANRGVSNQVVKRNLGNTTVVDVIFYSRRCIIDASAPRGVVHLTCNVQIIALDTTDTMMYSWSSGWYDKGGDFTQTDAFELAATDYTGETGLLIHPTESFVYVSLEIRRAK